VGLAGAPEARGIPLVCNIIADPAGAGLVRPGRDITGVCHIVPTAVQVKAIRTMLSFRTLGVIYNPLEKNSVLMVEHLEALMDSCAFKVVKIAVSPPDDPASAVDKLMEKGAELLYLPSDSYIISRAAGITARAAELKLPVFSATEEPILKSGALFGLVSRYYNAGQFAGYKAEQILFHGVKARDIPMETLSRFSFIINMKAARQIGFIPPILALKFAEVITE
jgi:putative tryptophan/tyrosine transport system substrate-binding protein